MDNNDIYKQIELLDRAWQIEQQEYMTKGSLPNYESKRADWLSKIR